jgi:NADH dehydrogenase
MAHPLDTLVTVFGGSGFVGRHVVRSLARRDYRIRAAVRRPELAGHLQPMGRVGQIHSVQANLRNEESVRIAMQGASVVINLVGVLSQSGAQRFDAVHHEGAATVARAARDAGARLIHVSAIGADPDSASHYARSKALGEEAVREAVPDSIILRPSVVFGPEDQFTNRFAALARISPVMPLFGAETRLQPVYAGDVGEAALAAVDGRARPGGVYELGGPEVLTMREVVAMVLHITQRNRPLLPVPFGLARLQAQLLQFAPGLFNLTPDQVDLLRYDNVVSGDSERLGLTLPGLGISPDTMEAVAPQYLWRFRAAGQFKRKNA